MEGTQASKRRGEEGHGGIPQSIPGEGEGGKSVLPLQGVQEGRGMALSESKVREVQGGCTAVGLEETKNSTVTG